MPVRLISKTEPVILDECPTADDLIAYCGRVSNPDNQSNHATAEKLIGYLIRNKHWSPLQMVDMTVEITAPRDISRQMLRHQSMDFQEFSQRYAEALGFAAPREARLQDPKNRQNSLPCTDIVLTLEWQRRQQRVLDFCRREYDWALAQGLAKECARVVLPEGLTLSRLYMKGSLRSWIHYLDVRACAATQKEHRDIAFLIAEIVKSTFPKTV